MDENVNFDLCCLFAGSKKVQQYSPGSYILNTYKYSSNELNKTSFVVNPMETVCKIDENLTFDLFLPYSRSTKTQKLPLGSIFYTLIKAVFEKMHPNLQQNPIFTYFYL